MKRAFISISIFIAALGNGCGLRPLNNDLALQSMLGGFPGETSAPPPSCTQDRSGALSYQSAYQDLIANSGSADIADAIDQPGLDGVINTALSPDGRNLYLAANNISALLVFGRNPVTGKLDLRQIFQDQAASAGLILSDAIDLDGLAGISGILVSPDGRNLYVTSFDDSALLVFSREPLEGILTFHQAVDNSGAIGSAQTGLNGARLTAISPDGKNLYVSAGYSGDCPPCNPPNYNALLVFDRDVLTGELTVPASQAWQDTAQNDDPDITTPGVNDQNGLFLLNDIVISPDGLNLYAVGILDDALLVFTRDPGSGLLAFSQVFDDTGSIGTSRDGLDGAYNLAVSPDGKNLYVTGSVDNALLVFNRDGVSGNLTFMQGFSDGGTVGSGNLDGLGGAHSVIVSPDGADVYIGSLTDKALVAFQRDSVSGSLTVQQKFSAEGSAIGTEVRGMDPLSGTFLSANRHMSVSPDCANIYFAGGNSDALLVFRRD